MPEAGRLGNLRVAVIGAGIAGLTAAIDLAHRGCHVTVLERGNVPGGKVRQVGGADQPMDAGPTVFTLRQVFDQLFDDVGDHFAHRVQLIRAGVLARHSWNSSAPLDLFAEVERSADAIGDFSGSRDAAGFLRFAAQAQRIYATLDATYMRAPRPSVPGLVQRIGLRRLPDLWNIRPFTTLWRAAADYFHDPRLRQLFARYATYCGSSPFDAPATLMLIAHVEQAGVWYVQGGMYRLAVELAALAERRGATLRYASEVARLHLERGRIAAVQTAAGERIAVDAVVCNADTNALAIGLFGDELRSSVHATPQKSRSLSAVTWNLVAQTRGFDLAHHSVFFSSDYRAEFDDIFRHHRLPRVPTVYICAQDRHERGERPLRERLLCLINAPPSGDHHSFTAAEIDACGAQVFSLLEKHGLAVQPTGPTWVTHPADFERLFPGTGGSLYGPASHGWMASFRRPAARSTVPGLYLAGGSSHPGPGVPMAAISGRLAAASILADRVSIGR